MSKEVHVGPGVPEGLSTGLAALPDPGPGKKLIVFIRGSSVRLRVDRAPSIIGLQETEDRVGSLDPPR